MSNKTCPRLSIEDFPRVDWGLNKLREVLPCLPFSASIEYPGTLDVPLNDIPSPHGGTLTLVFGWANGPLGWSLADQEQGYNYGGDDSEHKEDTDRWVLAAYIEGVVSGVRNSKLGVIL